MAQMDGPVAGSAIGIELHLNQTPVRWRWGTGIRWTFKDELVGHFRLKMDSISTPKTTPSF